MTNQTVKIHVDEKKMSLSERTRSDQIKSIFVFTNLFSQIKTFDCLDSPLGCRCYFNVFFFSVWFQTAKGYILLFDVLGGRDEKYLYEPVYPK